MIRAAVTAIECHLPQATLTNADLAAQFPDWAAEKVSEKIGIEERRLAAAEECASDLGVAAACKLFAGGACQPADVDFLLFCTQSPDYLLPTTACLVQDRLGIPTTAGALDYNLGCSGFVYGLSLASGLIETGQARNVLLITAETYSKFLHPDDRSVRCLFGDAAAATLVQGVDGPVAADPWVGPFVFGTDGAGAKNLIVPGSGLRRPANGQDSPPAGVLSMNGPEIFAFTLRTVPRAIQALLAKSGTDMGGVDLFVFHQANRYMLEHLRKKAGIPEGKMVLALRECGNTVSATIPIALRQAVNEGRLRPGGRVMLIGFGVGYSWAAALMRWYGP